MAFLGVMPAETFGTFLEYIPLEMFDHLFCDSCSVAFQIVLYGKLKNGKGRHILAVGLFKAFLSALALFLSLTPS